MLFREADPRARHLEPARGLFLAHLDREGYVGGMVSFVTWVFAALHPARVAPRPRERRLRRDSAARRPSARRSLRAAPRAIRPRRRARSRATRRSAHERRREPYAHEPEEIARGTAAAMSERERAAFLRDRDGAETEALREAGPLDEPCRAHLHASVGFGKRWASSRRREAAANAQVKSLERGRHRESDS